MRYHPCKHCSASCEIDFTTCSHCACLTVGCWVSTPDGSGEIVQARHSGGLVVNVDGIGTRQYRGDQLALTSQPAREAEPPIAPDHTAWCEPLRDPDPLRPYRRELMSRSFGPLAFAESRR